ncbi:MAG TPA: hypothetical protein VKY90_16435 [Candidatus Dormibacteraeota bacterium]|nr:hypothetical protein [Candidatus Dormibacteraeota bacterium]
MIGSWPRKVASTPQGCRLEVLSMLRLEHVARRPMRELNSVDAKLIELARLAASDLQVVLLDELLAGPVPAERRFVLETLDTISTQPTGRC